MPQLSRPQTMPLLQKKAANYAVAANKAADDAAAAKKTAECKVELFQIAFSVDGKHNRCWQLQS